MKDTRALPPGPAAPEWVQTIAFSQNPFEYVRGCARRHGDAYTARMAGMGRIALFGGPEAIREIFALPAAEMRTGNDVVRYLLHERSVIFLEGEEHKLARRALTPPFHGAQLDSYGPLYIKAVRDACAGWGDGETVNMHQAFQRATFDSLMKAIFGEAEIPGGGALRAELLAYVNGQLTNGMFFASVMFGQRLYQMLRGRTERARADLARGRSPSGLGFLAGRAANLAKVETLLQSVIEERKASGATGDDALGRMLASGKFTDDDIARQILTLLIAGHDTTSLALSWMMIQVLERPEVHARLTEEILGASGAGELGGDLNPDRVDKLPYLGAVVAESLRFTPIAAFVPRRMDRDVQIGGATIPAGTTMAANIIAAHSRPATWGDPEVFRPERFLGVEPTPWTFLPFGGGARRCLGAAFATFEMKCVFAQLIADWRIEIAPGYRAKPAVHGFLIGPAKPLRAVVRRRAKG